MWLGIDAKSVSIYAMANKQQPIKSYQWSELTDMSYRGNNFIIKHTQRLPACEYEGAIEIVRWAKSL